MKNQLLKVVPFLLIMLMLQAQTCVEKDHGPEVKVTRTVGTFSSIDVSDGIDVYLTMGPSEPLVVEAQERLIDDLITEVKDGVLKVYFDKSISFVRKASVHVSTPKLVKVRASGGSDFKAENIVRGKELVLEASGGSDMRLEVDVENLGIKTSGGSDVYISGKADKLVARTSGGSDLHGSDLKVHTAKLESSGGSDIKIYVLDELTAIASGGSDIIYEGNPSKLKIESSSSSDVIRKE
jgi:hypothetical protein